MVCFDVLVLAVSWLESPESLHYFLRKKQSVFEILTFDFIKDNQNFIVANWMEASLSQKGFSLCMLGYFMLSVIYWYFLITLNFC